MGAFAANDEAKPEFSNLETEVIGSSMETMEAETTIDVVRAEIIVNCEDGSSYTVSCDTCSTSQLVGIAMALCA
ncbi:hypothetical protein OQ279_08810 [Salinimicrobium sp. MT39]|uniref:Uncharacterized protein n=1 Tax=Salinimicrobium profundisediminis TaxID=2994553 RepID=A0A9X3CX12_9FLAO|nr:hypothetical protein [Salinimicrobium profundisediminis]MCX2838255.1 hypothetical protein [Salinimicrobium profundisediminis]